MAETSTVARPYARAVFELASERGELARWSELLRGLAGVLADERVASMLDDPDIGGERIAQTIIEATGGRIDEHGHNFVRLLAEKDRLDALPLIAERFEELRAEAERTVDVEVISAAPLDEDHRRRVAEQLRQRLGRDVRLDCRVDASLLGGALIRAGDLVIDGSVRGRLERLATNLSA